MQDQRSIDLSAAPGVAVREYSTDTGPADYVLFVGRVACGVIEAKKDTAGAHLTAAEAQTGRYATSHLKWRKDSTPLRFLFEATGQVIRFTDGADPAPRSREVFHFFRPDMLADWLREPNTLRRSLQVACRLFQRKHRRRIQLRAIGGRVHTQGVWFYDLRTNQHFTLKTRPLTFDDLQDFIACYHPENRHQRVATERFKYYRYDELVARGKASLDIFWLKDESLDHLDDLPPPEVLQQEVIEHLEAALAAFRDVAAALPGRGVRSA